MSLIYLYLNQPDDERWIVAVRIACCFLFLPLQQASDLRACETLSCSKRNERARVDTHTHTHTHIEKEGPWHNAGLFLIKVTLATTISLSLSMYAVLSFSPSSLCVHYDLPCSIPFLSHLTCTFCIIYFIYKRR
jgi:hypothetical protein